MDFKYVEQLKEPEKINFKKPSLSNYILKKEDNAKKFKPIGSNVRRIYKEATIEVPQKDLINWIGLKYQNFKNMLASNIYKNNIHESRLQGVWGIPNYGYIN